VSLIVIGTFLPDRAELVLVLGEVGPPQGRVADQRHLPYLIGVRDETTALIVGIMLIVLFFVITFVGFYWMCRRVKGAEFDEFMERWGWPRFTLTWFLLANMVAVVAKMMLRHLFNIKYVMVLKTPYFSINI
jgi:hypothetical protein